MRIYKIYANCCVASKPIKEITVSDAEREICEAVHQILNDGEDLGVDWNDEKYEDEKAINEAYEELYAKAIAHFKKYEYFDCGDYTISAYQDDEEPERANSYGWTRDFWK